MSQRLRQKREIFSWLTREDEQEIESEKTMIQLLLNVSSTATTTRMASKQSKQNFSAHSLPEKLRKTSRMKNQHVLVHDDICLRFLIL